MSNSTLEQFNIQGSNELSWNVMPLLHQIKHAMHNLLENNINEIIDLRSIPLAPGEEDRLLEILGEGEVNAQLNALGLSDIIETQYTGVWLVTHRNDENEIISRNIEISLMPEILLAQKEDISLAYERLAMNLDEK